MLPAAKKRNKKRTWETSRTQWVCETIGKLSLRGGIPSRKDSHRTGEHTAGTGVTGSRSLRKEEIVSSSSWELSPGPWGRKSCRAPGTEEPEQQAGLSAQSTQPCLLLGEQLLRQLQNLPQTTTENTQSTRKGWAGLIRLILPKGCGAHSHNTPAGSWERICIPSLLCLGSPSGDERDSLPGSDSEIPKSVQSLSLAGKKATLGMIMQMDKFCSKFGIWHFSHNLCSWHNPKGQTGSYWQVWPPWDTDSWTFVFFLPTW